MSNRMSEVTSLHTACQKGHTEVVKDLVGFAKVGRFNKRIQCL